MTPDVLVSQLTFTHLTLNANTEGLTHAESLIRPPSGGSSINYLAGHVTATRNGMLSRLGLPPLWTDDEARGYRRGEPPREGAACHPFETILATFNRSQEQLTTAIAGLEPERLATPVPHPVRPDETVPLEIALGLFAFHEAYHVGQTGVLRRVIGKPGVIA
jgi:uncharacterized damage-inducible protein DinB